MLKLLIFGWKDPFFVKGYNCYFWKTNGDSFYQSKCDKNNTNTAAIETSPMVLQTARICA